MTRSAWRGRDGDEGTKEGGGEAEKRRVRVERMPPVDDGVPERGRGRERFSFWGVRCGGDALMELVVRMVLVREEILAARRASWSWFSVWDWVQRHAEPWMWILGRVFWGLSNSRHSVFRSRFGRAGARGVHDILLEGSSWMVQDVRASRGGPSREWCLTESVVISAIFSCLSLLVLEISFKLLVASSGGGTYDLIHVGIGDREQPCIAQTDHRIFCAR
jgi:hypothetical protein